MKKLDMQTTDLTQSNIEKIKALFPNAVTEASDGKGGLRYSINFDILEQELTDDVIEDGEECYDFTWVGKNQAILEANTPINKTLRPCIEESKDWENTENLYIEGDNLEVLKLLQESYLNKIKMIYIDPPYNTGNDFVYRDKRHIDKDEYVEETKQIDEDEHRLFRNTETNGRFHSDWCTMLYPRLKLARNLLTEDGVIFISIDDNEVDNLRKIGNEVFGEENFVSTVAVVNNLKGRSDDEYIATAHENILIFRKSKGFITYGVPLPEEYLNEYKEEDQLGKYRLLGLRKRGTNSRREDRPNMYYPLYGNSKTMEVSCVKNNDFDIEILPKLSDGSDGCWRWGKSTANERVEELVVKHIGTRNEYDVYQKDYLETNGERRTTKAKSVWLDKKFSSDSGTISFRELFNNKAFTSPKSVELLKYCLYQASKENDIVLDFFSGSSTTAHATMKLNAEDGGNRKFIMVQLDEPTDEKSEAYKAGYKNICEIGKERIRRAGEKIKEEIEEENNKQKTTTHTVVTGRQVKIFEEEKPDAPKELKKVPDIGFRVLKVDDTNMKDVYYSAGEYSQTMLDEFASNIKEDRTDMDLLYQVLLDWGLPLSLKHKIEKFKGYTLHTVDENALIACFNDNLSEELIREMAKRQPLRVVFRDSCFKDSPDKINVEEIFKLHAPNTSVRVI